MHQARQGLSPLEAFNEIFQTAVKHWKGVVKGENIDFDRLFEMHLIGKKKTMFILFLGTFLVLGYIFFYN